MINYRRYLKYLLSSPITITIIALYWLVFIFFIIGIGFSQNPDHLSYFVQWGASVQALTFGNEPWRLGTAALLSRNIAQLVIISIAIALAGFIAEKRLGKWRMALIFALGATAGTLMATIYTDQGFIVGGVGGIGTWIGYCTAHYRLRLPVATNDSELEKLLQSHTNKYFIITCALVILLILVFFNSALFIGGLLASFFLFTFTVITVRLPDRAVANMLQDISAVILCGVMATIAAANYKGERNISLRSSQLLTAIANADGSDSFSQHKQNCILHSSGESVNSIFIDSVNCLAQQGLLTNNKLTQQQQQTLVAQQRNWQVCSKRAQQLVDQTFEPEIKQLGILAKDYCYSRGNIDASFVPEIVDSSFYPDTATEEQIANMQQFNQLYLASQTSLTEQQKPLFAILQQWREPTSERMKDIIKLDANCLFLCSKQRKLAAFSQNNQQ